MANSQATVVNLPYYFAGGVEVYEHEITIDTISTPFVFRNAVTGKFMTVVGLLLNSGTTAAVTIKSGGSRARTFNLTANSQVSAYLYTGVISQNISIESATTITSLIVHCVEMNSAQLVSTLNVGSSGGGSGGISQVNGIYNATAPSLSDEEEVQLQVDASGSLKTNNGSYGGTGIHSNPSISTSSSTVISANSNRTTLIIANQDATNTVYIRFDGATATAANGVPLGPKGYWESPPGFIVRNAVTAIAVGGTVILSVVEGN